MPERSTASNFRAAGSASWRRRPDQAARVDTRGRTSTSFGAEVGLKGDDFDAGQPDQLGQSGAGDSGDTGARGTEAAASAGSKRRPGAVKSLRARALGYLSRRDHSRTELLSKLRPFMQETDTAASLDTLLDALEEEGWLSNARFAESLMHRRAPRFGVSRVLNELKRHGVDDDLVQDVGTALRGSEYERACAVWRKRFRGVLPTTQAERAKQSRFLAARGFSGDTISRLFKSGAEAFDPTA